MKITKVQTTHVEVPADEPLANGPSEKGAVRKLIATKISTDEGLQGISVAFFGAAITPALKSAIDSLGALAVGMDPQLTEAGMLLARAEQRHFRLPSVSALLFCD